MQFGGRHRAGAFGFILLVCVVLVRAAHAQTDYVIGIPDVLVVNVWGQATLSGRYQVTDDGSFSFPFIGKVQAAGRHAQEIETDIADRLSKGYLRQPQVSVTVAEFLSQRVFVMGEVRTPGPIPVMGSVTLLDALARAGSFTSEAGGDVLVVRPKTPRPGNSPVMPGEPDATIVMQASVRDLRRGTLTRNEPLKPGDTVFVSHAESFQVLGQVLRPGSFPYEAGMTVLRALSLAGGANELGAQNRIKIVRVTDGTSRELKVKLSDQVQPGDTLVVPARIW